MKIPSSYTNHYNRYAKRKKAKGKKPNKAEFLRLHRKKLIEAQKRFIKNSPLRNSYVCWKFQHPSRLNISFELYLELRELAIKDKKGRINSKCKHTRLLYKSLGVS